jgi:hypothetical protein
MVFDAFVFARVLFLSFVPVAKINTNQTNHESLHPHSHITQHTHNNFYPYLFILLAQRPDLLFSPGGTHGPLSVIGLFPSAGVAVEALITLEQEVAQCLEDGTEWLTRRRQRRWCWCWCWFLQGELGGQGAAGVCWGEGEGFGRGSGGGGGAGAVSCVCVCIC